MTDARYWILQLEWSQTDKEMVIVRAISQEAAISKYKYPNGPRYVNCYGSTREIVEAR